jgi:hypothetical protein
MSGACVWDGTPGDWPACCPVHELPMCDHCRRVPGSSRHRPPQGRPRRKPNTCSSCEAPVKWARTERGARMPLDPEPRSDGNLVVEGAYARAVQSGDPGPFFVSHFATCPNANKHRRPR